MLDSFFTQKLTCDFRKEIRHSNFEQNRVDRHFVFIQWFVCRV